jgi:hypothetical protein
MKIKKIIIERTYINIFLFMCLLWGSTIFGQRVSIFGSSVVIEVSLTHHIRTIMLDDAHVMSFFKSSVCPVSVNLSNIYVTSPNSTIAAYLSGISTIGKTFGNQVRLPVFHKSTL